MPLPIAAMMFAPMAAQALSSVFSGQQAGGPMGGLAGGLLGGPMILAQELFGGDKEQQIHADPFGLHGLRFDDNNGDKRPADAPPGTFPPPL